ncbi:MAG: lipid-A-disaccharide synthase [Planctomycetes bacterium]|nr:lipid-A-disaccharide synthase [Planctomycetota bacterium]
MEKDYKTYRVFLSAAEPSGDLHCAGLIRALKKSGKNIEFFGVGGELMEQEGCQLLAATVNKAAMLSRAFGRVAFFYNLIRRIRKFLKKEKIDLVIVCDSPAFNFHIAKAAKKHGVKTLFYVAPQLWAWAGWRIKKLKACCDKLCCILPFEEDWFGSRGVETVFVGNPMLDGFESELSDNQKDYSDFDANKVKIALLPGSRSAEIATIWEPMQKMAIKLKRKYPGAEFTAIAVDERRKEILKSMHLLGFRCKYTTSGVHEICKEVDFSIVASGSVTVQVAATGCPMVVVYQSSKFLWYLLGWWLLQTKHLSLVNILSRKELVPEFMPYFSSIDPVVEAVDELLSDKEKLSELSGELINLTEPLGRNNAAEKTSQIVMEMLE